MGTARWNFRIEDRICWLTRKPTTPARPCRCGAEAVVWVASDYYTGRSRNVSTNYKGHCQACAEKTVTKHNQPEPEAQMPQTSFLTHPTPTEALKMARKKAKAAETTENTAAPAAKGRKKKATETAPTEPTPAVEITADEAALVERYGKTHQLVAGSLRYAGAEDRPGWGHKRTVLVTCCLPECGATRIVATSDLQWDTTKYCLTCVKSVKRGRKSTKEAKKKL